jgi:hypothetical protein
MHIDLPLMIKVCDQQGSPFPTMPATGITLYRFKESRRHFASISLHQPLVMELSPQGFLANLVPPIF